MLFPLPTREPCFLTLSGLVAVTGSGRAGRVENTLVGKEALSDRICYNQDNTTQCCCFWVLEFLGQWFLNLDHIRIMVWETGNLHSPQSCPASTSPYLCVLRFPGDSGIPQSLRTVDLGHSAYYKKEVHKTNTINALANLSPIKNKCVSVFKSKHK